MLRRDASVCICCVADNRLYNALYTSSAVPGGFMKTTRIAFFVLFCLVFILIPQDKTVMLDNGDVIHGKVKEAEDSYKIKSDVYGVITVPKTRVKKIIESNDALAAERDLVKSGMSSDEGARTMTTAAANENKVAINDFTVNSENPEHKFLGKGFSELISYEVKKSPRIRLVEREKRNDLFKEMELSMTGMVEEKDAVKAGKILACDYIVFGEIVDMPGTLLVSLRMTRVETGEVVWRKQITEPGKNYPYISAFFAKDILTSLGLGVDKSIEANIATKKSMDQEAVVKLSKGIDAYDKKDTARAKEELEAAKKLDPQNKVVQDFINRLVANSAKYKVMPDRITSYHNSAFLGFVKTDKFFFSTAADMNMFSSDTHNPAIYWKKAPSQDLFTYTVSPDGLGSIEQMRSAIMIFGYSMPLAPWCGVGIEAYLYGSPFSEMSGGGTSTGGAMGSWDYTATGRYYISNGTDGYSGPTPITLGGDSKVSIARATLTFGMKLSDNVGIGIGASFYNERREAYEAWRYNAMTPAEQAQYMSNMNDPALYKAYNVGENYYFGGGQIGLLIKDGNDDIYFDTIVGFSLEKQYMIDTFGAANLTQTNLTRSNYITRMQPIYNENTFTMAFNNKSTFIVLKEYNDIAYDRFFIFSRFMPAVEQWFFDLFSLRAGLELGVAFGKSQTYSIGGLAGTTLRLKPFGQPLDIDLNYTYRNRPSRLLEEVLVPEQIVFFTLSYSGILFREK